MFSSSFLACLILIIGALAGEASALMSEKFALQPDQLEEVTISTETIVLSTMNIPASVVIVQFQVHSHIIPLTLSMDEELVESRYTNGTNIGVLVELGVESSEAQCYIRCPQCTHNTTVAVTATYLTSTDPVPGACNFEFPLENDPNMHIPSQKFINPVEFQYANFGKGRGKPWQNCEMDDQSHMVYDVYQMFFPYADSTESTFFENIRLVLNRTEFLKKARKIETIHYGKGKPEAHFASYYGRGVAYAVVVSHSIPSVASSVYVPVITYNCNFTAHGYCNMKTSGIITIQVVSTFLALIGAILCFTGHRIFKTSLFTFGSLAFTLVFLTILMRFSTWSVMTVVLSSIAFGIVFGVLWLLLWVFVGSPALSVLIPATVLGYLWASIIFFATPLSDLTVFHSSLNYGMCFAFIVLVPCLLIPVSRVLHVLCCTMVGSFLVIFAFDQFTYGNLQHILTISLKKTISNEFLLVHNTWPPFTTSDIILTVALVVLCGLGMGFQYHRERGHRPFPPCPYQQYRWRRDNPDADADIPRGPVRRLVDGGEVRDEGFSGGGRGGFGGEGASFRGVGGRGDEGSTRGRNTRNRDRNVRVVGQIKQQQGGFRERRGQGEEQDPLLADPSPTDPTRYEVVAPGRRRQGSNSGRYGAVADRPSTSINAPRPINDVSGFYDDDSDSDGNARAGNLV